MLIDAQDETCRIVKDGRAFDPILKIVDVARPVIVLSSRSDESSAFDEPPTGPLLRKS
jgi:hypothetical protein